MKKNTTFYLSLLTLFISIGNANASGSWLQKASFPGTPRKNATSFVIGHYAFVGCGADASNYYSDFYKWNQSTNSWSIIGAYPGGGRDGCSGFTIEGKGYVGLGNDGSARHTDLWRFDTISNAWTQMASLPSSGRYS